MALIDIFLMVFIFSASSLCIFSIIYMKRIFEQVEAIRKDINRLVENTIPLLSNLKDVTHRANRIATEVEEYWEKIDYSIRNLREKISNSGYWKKFYYAQIHIAVLIKSIRSIAKGLSVFWNEYKHI